MSKPNPTSGGMSTKVRAGVFIEGRHFFQRPGQGSDPGHLRPPSRACAITTRSGSSDRFPPAVRPSTAKRHREVECPRGEDGDAYFFQNPDGRPVTTTWWPKKSWTPVLKKHLKIRHRKFYALRATFISWALSQGANLK
jgi:hypothetical protein